MDRRLSNHTEIDSRLKGREKFETFLHEALLLALPHLSEYEVLKAARFQALVTWSEGYRHREKPASRSQQIGQPKCTMSFGNDRSRNGACQRPVHLIHPIAASFLCRR